MFKVSEKFKKEINKLGGRSFVSKVVIRDKEYNDDVIIDMSLDESVNPGDNFSLGSVVSNTFEINLINVDTSVIFKEATIKPYVGLKLDDEIEYIPLGVFTVDNVTIKDKKVKLECMDNMIKLERAYFSDLKYPCNINQILKEICIKSNITCNSILPNYSIDEIKGYSFRQAIGILATLCGCFARFNRIGELEILSYTDTDLRITPDTFFKIETNDKDYIIGKITAKKGQKTFSKGSNTEIIIDNPVITEGIVNDLYNKFKDFTYRPYTLSWQGNPSVQAGDKVEIVDINGKVYNTLIMEQKFTYNGGIKSELKASGKTESSDRFDIKGSITQTMENYSIEQASIKKALIKKADIDSLDVIDARINNLYAQDLKVLNAKIIDLQSNKISTLEFNALESKLQHALIGKADVNELNVAVERVGILEGKTLSVENQLAGNLTAKNFKANSITAGSGIIAEGAIGTAQISSLSVNKLEAGDITTSKHKIVSEDGTIEIVGNQILINRNNVNRVILGEYRKQDNTTDYGLLIRAKDGKTIMLDGEGVHNAGITDGAINNNKVADNANISGNKLDINSVIREVNNKGTETIKGTKVTVGDRTLDLELSTQKNTITEHGKELSNQKTTINALDNAIKLKVDNQTFTQSTSTINNNINNLNSDLVSKINSSLSTAKSYSDSKKQEAINNSNAHADSVATNKANESLNNAKAYTNAQVTTVNSNLSKVTSEINILKGQINTKVGQVDIDRSISNINFGGRNYLLGSKDIFLSGSDFPNNTNREKGKITIITPNEPWNAYYFWNGFGDIKAGLDIICSVDIKVNSNKGCIRLDGGNNKFNHGNPKTYDLSNFELNKWTRISATSKTTKEMSNLLCISGRDNDKGLVVEYRNFKMSLGKIQSDWTPAPEDTDKLIVNNIKVVTDKINDVSTKFIQAKDSLQASVNSLNSTTQTITTNLTKTNNDLSNKINIAKNEAINNSKSYADTKKNEAISSANAHADSKANDAKNQAIVGARKIPDTRNDNQTPYWYMMNYTYQTITEFKFARVIQIPNSNNSYNYGTLETKVPWGDSSGGYPTQIFRSNSYPTYQRHGISNTAWSSWEQIEDTQGSQAKANNALNSANAYTTAQITTVNTRVSNAESSINILKNQISTKVSQSDIDKTVNNIELGGRNLIPNSYINAETNAYGAFGRKLTINLEEGKTYCFSIRGHIDQTASNNKKNLTCYIYEDTWNYGCVSITIHSIGINQTKYALFTPKKTGVYNFATYMYPSGGNRDGKVHIEWAKLEKGNKATDWTPAPEDIGQEIKDNITTVTEKINTVESTFTQKTNNINAAVSSVQSILNTKADGSTVSSMQSQLASINIGLDGIKNEVAKKTDKGSIISAINQSAEEIKIDASKIKLNGLTTFASRTGLKAIQIESNNILFYDWEGSERKDIIGQIYSTRTNGDARKPGIAIGHKKNSTFDIVYQDGNDNSSFMTFDKDNILNTGFPITFNQDVSLNSYVFWLGKTKRNSMYESDKGDFTVRTAHGLKVVDKDNLKITADLDANQTIFCKWDHEYAYAEFRPDEFCLSNGKGTSYFWTEKGNSNIYTGARINLRVQGDLSVNGKKNRIVKDTVYGDLMLNAIESTECWFTDTLIEQSRTDSNGDCIIWFDNKFLQTVNTRFKYKIDVTPIGEFASNGKLTYVRVVEKTEKYFKVRGTPNTLFDWTITAKQKGYERDRLEVLKAS